MCMCVCENIVCSCVNLIAMLLLLEQHPFCLNYNVLHISLCLHIYVCVFVHIYVCVFVHLLGFA